jgi:hypothetical protein
MAPQPGMSTYKITFWTPDGLTQDRKVEAAGEAAEPGWLVLTDTEGRTVARVHQDRVIMLERTAVSDG